MPQFRLSPSADRDMDGIHEWTVQKFGEQIWRRYNELLSRSFLDLTSDPKRRGTEALSGLDDDNLFIYHIKHSRNLNYKIKKPRHLILYRIINDEIIEIIRVLHDSMDPALHFPVDTQSEIGEEDE